MNFTGRLLLVILTITCLITTYNPCTAQDDHSTGNWNSIFLKGKISPRWSLFGEDHIRSTTYDFKYDYFEIKAGVSYAATKNLAVLFGAGYYNTDEPGGFLQTPALQRELRTWVELNYKHNLSRCYFEHRGRLEQRFIGSKYKNRLKYRLGLTIPVNSPTLLKGTIYLAVNDELFIPQYNSVLIEKNRFFIGTGYKMNDNASLQIGCVHDTDYKSDNTSVKNYIQVMFLYDFTNLIKKHS